MMLSHICLSDVCLSVMYTGPKSRIERPRKAKIGTEVAHVTHDSDITFKVKRPKVKVTRLLCIVLARQAAAAVGVRMCWPWENCCYVTICLVAQGASAPLSTGGGEGPPAYSLLGGKFLIFQCLDTADWGRARTSGLQNLIRAISKALWTTCGRPSLTWSNLWKTGKGSTYYQLHSSWLCVTHNC